MSSNTILLKSIRNLLKKAPKNWLTLTTHRLDIYNEEFAKSEFLDTLKSTLTSKNYETEQLEQLPTAYDYIRLGHQLSSVLEWVLAEINDVGDDQVITFASQTMPILALLRKNKLSGKATEIYYDMGSAPLLDEKRLREVYGYEFQLKPIANACEIQRTSDSSLMVWVTQKPFQQSLQNELKADKNIDVAINIHPDCGAAAIVFNNNITNLVSDIQHVRRRESIAMTPANCFRLLQIISENHDDLDKPQTQKSESNRQIVHQCIQQNTGSDLTPLIASSGLSIQYAMMMGTVEYALTHHPEKPIKIILPPNCYGGTNDQCRRIAAMIPQVDIVDLPVDGGNDMVESLNLALESVAQANGVPLVLAEIPTNPRVEVPDMKLLAKTLKQDRYANDIKGITAVKPIFMVDQTFCPNVKLLDSSNDLHEVKVVSFTSGSKFPSGGRCIAGYCTVNHSAKDLMNLISAHLQLSDNQADYEQLQILAEVMPSMPERIIKAFENTQKLVAHVQDLLPSAKIFYVSKDIAQNGFWPSVFSLDLPVTGKTASERTEHQKQLNKKLIEFMIQAHPTTCKNCVSYGQLKGSYWTIPATSTQGTTKEEDKDYVVRVALSPEVDTAALAKSFTEFCQQNGLI